GHQRVALTRFSRKVLIHCADFTTIALDSVRTAGTLPRLGAETAVFAATAADVRHTVVAGRPVVRDGAHTLVPDVPKALADAVEALRA
ncbi:hypothetical protein ACWD7F_22535, partial [Streptomyces sp. NPDC005122]